MLWCVQLVFNNISKIIYSSHDLKQIIITLSSTVFQNSVFIERHSLTCVISHCCRVLIISSNCPHHLTKNSMRDTQIMNLIHQFEKKSLNFQVSLTTALNYIFWFGFRSINYAWFRSNSLFTKWHFRAYLYIDLSLLEMQTRNWQFSQGMKIYTDKTLRV